MRLRSELECLLGGRIRRSHNGRSIGNVREWHNNWCGRGILAHPLIHPLFWWGYMGHPLRVNRGENPFVDRVR